MRPRTAANKPVVIRTTAFEAQQPNVYARPQLSRTRLDIVEAVERRWILALILFVGILGAGLAWTAFTWQSTYKSETTIFVPPDSPGLTADAEQSIYATFLNQQILGILRYGSLSEVIERLHEKGIEWRRHGEPERNAVDRLRSLIDVERVPNSNEIAIDVTSNRPLDAAVIANTIAQTFLDGQSQSSPSGHMDRAQLLAMEKAKLTEELTGLVAENGKFAEALQSADVSKPQVLPTDRLLVDLRAAAEDAHRKRVEAEIKLGQLELTARSDAERAVKQDPAVQTVMAGLWQRKYQLLQSIEGMLPSHPVRMAAEREIASIDVQLEQGPDNAIPKMAASVLAQMRAEVEATRRVETKLDLEVKESTARLPSIAKALGRAELTKANLTRVQNRLSKIQGESDDLSLRHLSGDTMHVFSPATPAAAPIKTKALQFVILSLFLAVVAAVSVPSIQELLDTRIYDPITVESLLGFPVVGIRLKPSPKTAQFGAEHLRKLVAGLARGIEGGASSILLTGLKEPVPATLISDIWRHLSRNGIKVTLSAGVSKLASEFRDQIASPRLRAPAGPNSISLDERELLMMDAPALLFSSETERLALEADITIIVVQACTNTRSDLLRAAQVLQKISVPAVGVILDNVRVERAGRQLRRDLRQYIPLQSHLARFTLGVNDPPKPL